MYRCSMFNPDLERFFTVEADTVKEAVTRCWRLSVGASCGEDASSWEPEGVRVTAQDDPRMTRITALPDHADRPLVVVDQGRMTIPCGFVTPTNKTILFRGMAG
jgi:hypothetical protein